MSQDVLSHNLVVRISPTLRDELSLAASCDDITVGRLVRRAIEREIREPIAREMRPFTVLPPEEVLQHLSAALDTLQDPKGDEDFIFEVGNDLVDVLDSGFQTLDCLHDESQHHRLVRAAGYLQQLSLSALRAASRVRALRAVHNYDDYPTPRVEAAEPVEG